MTSLRNRALKEWQDKINSLRIEADRLEGQRGLNAREAVAAVEQARTLRKQADRLENQSQFSMQQYLNERQAEIQLEDSQAQDRVRTTFSEIQNELLGQENAFNEAVDVAYNSMVYNTAIGVSESMVKRQVAKLLRGEGITDSKGNRYVEFTEGRNNPTYRAIATTDGHIGVVTAGMGGAGGGE